MPRVESGVAARRLVRSFCAERDVDDDLCEDAAVIATELVSNVVDHAGTPCELSVRTDGTQLWIEVRDYLPCPAPRPRPFDPRARRGRGLQVVSALSTRWGVTEFPDGKSVWAVLALSTVASDVSTAE